MEPNEKNEFSRQGWVFVFTVLVAIWTGTTFVLWFFYDVRRYQGLRHRYLRLAGFLDITFVLQRVRSLKVLTMQIGNRYIMSRGRYL